MKWLQACERGVCVEVQYRRLDVAVRYAPYGVGRTLLVPRTQWADFMQAVKSGRLDEVTE